MASPIKTRIPAEEQAHICHFVEQLQTKLRPHASNYRYSSLLRLLDHDPIPTSFGTKEEEETGCWESRQEWSNDLLKQANHQFQRWKQLSIDLLADKDSQSEAIIHDETERLKTEIEAQASRRALMAGEMVSSSNGPVEPDVSWLNECMAHRNTWRSSRKRYQRSSTLPSLLRQSHGPNVVSPGLPSARHTPRTPFSQVNGQLQNANRRWSTSAKQLENKGRSQEDRPGETDNDW